jgi:hypothetical protein
MAFMVTRMRDLVPPRPPNLRIDPDWVRAFEALSKEVSSFQDHLLSTQEVGISVNGADNVIHVFAIRRSGQMVVFEGTDSHGRSARLIQHYTQVNVQMIAVDTVAEQARRIGF